MWKRRRTWLLLLAVVGLTLAGLYESVTHVGRGWLRGEAFYQGRPTSYWRVLVELDLRDDPSNLRDKTWREPPQTFWERTMDRIGARRLPTSSVALNYQSGKSAESVFIELANDPDEKIAGFGRDIGHFHIWGPPELNWEWVVTKHHIE